MPRKGPKSAKPRPVKPRLTPDPEPIAPIAPAPIAPAPEPVKPPPIAPARPAKEPWPKRLTPEVARGFGPPPFRIALIVIAAIYLFLLVKHPTKKGWKTVFAHFAECTGLFPQADWVTGKDAHTILGLIHPIYPGTKEFRIEGYSCVRKRWEMMDPRPYFPIQADDKESRFARIVHYYMEESSKTDPVRTPTGRALEKYIMDRHADADDGIDGPIGGIQVTRLVRETGAPGDPVPRYHYDPLAPVQPDQRVDVEYRTPNKDDKTGPSRFTYCKQQTGSADTGSGTETELAPEPAESGSGSDDPWR